MGKRDGRDGKIKRGRDKEKEQSGKSGKKGIYSGERFAGEGEVNDRTKRRRKQSTYAVRMSVR